MIEGFASLQELARLVVQAVLNGVWQAVPVTLGVAAAMAFLRRTSAATRHLIWAATLLIVVTLPIAAVWLGSGVASAAGAPAVAASPANISAGEAVPLGASHAAAEAAGATWLIELPGGWWLVPLLGLAVLVAGVRLARLLLALRRVRRLKRASRPLAGGLGARLEELRDRHVGRRVALRVSGRITTPLTLGFLHPAVLLPERLVEELAEGELAQITLHELAHIRRHDHWSNLAQRAIEAIFFFHPVVLLVGKRLELERELACDEYTVANTGGECAYARCLTRLAELAVASREIELAPGAVSRGGQLSRRVQALLAPNRPVVVRTCVATCASFVAGVIAASFALAQAAPMLGIRTVPGPPPPASTASSPLGTSARASLVIQAGDENRRDRVSQPASESGVAAAARAADEISSPAGPVQQLAPSPRAGDATNRLPAPTVVAGTMAGAQWAMRNGQEQPLSVADAEEVAHGEADAPDSSVDPPAAGNRDRGGVRIDIAVALPFLPRARPVRAIGRPYPGGMPAPDHNTPVGDMVDAIRGEQIGTRRLGGIRLSIRGTVAPGNRGGGSFAPW